MDIPQDPNQITPSTPEQVQVVQGDTVAPTEPVAPQVPAETVVPTEPLTGYDNYSDDDFKTAYAALCTQMGREFGIRHDLVTQDNVTYTDRFTNVLVVAKKA